jgi:4-aminobutyrate aminotransferase
LSQLAQGCDRLSQPRGKGLMVAIDLLDDRGNLDPQRRSWIVENAFYRGLLLLGCGKAAIRFCPPLIITSEQVRVALDILSQLFQEMP